MEIVIPAVNLKIIAPQLIVALSAMVVLVVDLLLPRDRKSALAYLSLLGLALSFVASILLWGQEGLAFADMAVLDALSLFFGLIFLIVTAIVVLLSLDYIVQQGINYGEYYALLLFAASGMMLVAASANLIVLFLGLEMLSISLYILTGFARRRPTSGEAALKYFLLGAFASAFLLYGIALTYGATGTTDLARIADFLQKAGSPNNPMLLIGAGLLLIGFGFKVAMVPFHIWVPDVYEGAPTSITAFMSVGTKAAGFAALLRLLFLALPALQSYWTLALAVLSVLTMTTGNVIAIAQTNIKRMLAYSGIAHAGYLLIALASASQRGAASILFYLLVYTAINLGAFGMVIVLGFDTPSATQPAGQREEGEYLNLTDYAGLGFRRPALAAVFAIFLLSLGGIPPTAGFAGKFYIFSAAVEANLTPLAFIGILNAILSLFYYLRVVRIMYVDEPSRQFGHLPRPTMIALVVAALGALLLGLYPAPFIELAQRAVTVFGG
jgi:NADH-quinone oxidoreductase subunit N